MGALRYRLLLWVALPLALAGLHLTLTSAQVEEGATLTILRGQVALTRPDGSSVQPATSGLTVSAC